MTSETISKLRPIDTKWGSEFLPTPHSIQPGVYLLVLTTNLVLCLLGREWGGTRLDFLGVIGLHRKGRFRKYFWPGCADLSGKR